MVHPSYQLNPGDMFQVDVDKVLYGTGVQKPPGLKKLMDRRIEGAKKRDELAESRLREERLAAGEGVDAEAAAEGSETLSEEEEWALKTQRLESMLVDVKAVLRDKKVKKGGALSAADKTRLRVFRTSAKKFLAHPDDAEIDVDELMDELRVQMRGLDLQGQSFQPESSTEGVEGAEGEESSASSSEPKYNRKRMIDRALDMEGLGEEQRKKFIDIIGYEDISKDEMRNLAQMLKREAENPVDERKPYATPWRPRPFMAAFAFIPRYLEVNPNICAAVYLRHPVARKGLAEVPTPFPYFTNQLAHNWYLERG